MKSPQAKACGPPGVGCDAMAAFNGPHQHTARVARQPMGDAAGV
eukprot:gene16175-33921_t